MAGIYIHIPFCKQACNYCNFHFSTSLKFKKEVLAAMLQEIALVALQFPLPKNQRIESIYFGGGTPSLATPEELVMLLAAIRHTYNVESNAEITLEANPDDITPAMLQQWKKMGINRLSVGIQSFEEEELRWMNRAHTAADSLRCIDEIVAAGFDNFSIDLIYGSPLLTNQQWQKNVDIIFEKKVPHISCYALTVEPNTALHKQIAIQKKLPVDAEKQAAQFLLLMQWMEGYGYEHYEISNYALQGKRSRHNSSYWQGKNYIGLGPSAHSFDGQSRRWNVANNSLYIQSIAQQQIPFEREILTVTQQLNEYIMTSLRTIEGLQLERVSKFFGDSFTKKILQLVGKWQEGGKIEEKNGFLILTNEGKLFADGIAADLFFTDIIKK